MRDAIRIGIVGYGNLGRGVELAIARNPDMLLTGVFTRRSPEQVATVSADTASYGIEALHIPSDDIDVLVLCGGSKDDLPAQGPALAARFNTVDSFDTHARIPEYFAAVDKSARAAGCTASVACGWDLGLFSINRVSGRRCCRRARPIRSGGAG